MRVLPKVSIKNKTKVNSKTMNEYVPNIDKFKEAYYKKISKQENGGDEDMAKKNE